MNNRHQQDQLLDDILADAVPPGFHEALLKQALVEMRIRGRMRHRRQGAFVAALVLAACFALWRGIPPRHTKPVNTPACGLVLTRPLHPNQIVTTHARTAGIVSTSAGLVAPLATVPGVKLFHEFSDSELLTFLSGKPVALVAMAPNQEELVFLNPTDANGFEMR